MSATPASLHALAQQPQPGPSRRALLLGGLGAAALAGTAWPARHAAAHAAFGPVTPPLAPPALPLISADGQPSRLPVLLKGRITAVQLMFTGCSATCPIQGAIFADAQGRLAGKGSELRLLSISIDPLGDDPKALQAWLARFSAQPARWQAAVPRMQDVNALLDFLQGRAGGADRHTAQSYLFDRQGRLALRTADMASGGDLVQLMQELASMR